MNLPKKDVQVVQYDFNQQDKDSDEEVPEPEQNIEVVIESQNIVSKVSFTHLISQNVKAPNVFAKKGN